MNELYYMAEGLSQMKSSFEQNVKEYSVLGIKYNEMYIRNEEVMVLLKEAKALHEECMTSNSCKSDVWDKGYYFPQAFNTGGGKAILNTY